MPLGVALWSIQDLIHQCYITQMLSPTYSQKTYTLRLFDCWGLGFPRVPAANWPVLGSCIEDEPPIKVRSLSAIAWDAENRAENARVLSKVWRVRCLRWILTQQGESFDGDGLRLDY